MKPILYSSNETEFTSNGIGILSDAISCSVIEARNGEFELQMTYPVSGIHYTDIATRCLIMAKPNPVDDPQPFRIYRITKPMAGMVTIYGQHISYDLAGIPVSPFTANTVGEALGKLKSSAAVENPFTFWTDKSTVAKMQVSTPSAIRSLLGGQQGSVLDIYGGEYKFDRYLVRLYGQRGQNRGVSIRYGKNLTDLEQDENIAGVYTGVYPYWADMDGNLVQLPEKTLPAPGVYDFVRIMPLDLSGDFDTAPTVSQLRTRAQKYMEANNIGVPTVSLSVSFVSLEQSEEYKGMALLERVELCDTVNVEFPALGVSATAKCIRTEYNVLLDRYTSVDLGDARTNLADTIVAQQEQLRQTPDRTFIQQAVDSATGQITGNKGGYVLLHSSTGSRKPDEILIMDTPDINTAVKVWRWNKAGLGYSSSGYNGPYGLAMTQDGAIVADFITVGELTANIIKSGVLKSANGGTTFNLSNGIIRLKQNDREDGSNSGELEIWEYGITYRNKEKHLGSFYVSTTMECVAKAHSFNIADNDVSFGGLQLDRYNEVKLNADSAVFSQYAYSNGYVYAKEEFDLSGKSKYYVDSNGQVMITNVYLMDCQYIDTGLIRATNGISIRNSSGAEIGAFFQTTSGITHIKTGSLESSGYIKSNHFNVMNGNSSVGGMYVSNGKAHVSTNSIAVDSINSKTATRITIARTVDLPAFSIKDSNGTEHGAFYMTSANTSHIKADSASFRSLSVSGSFSIDMFNASDVNASSVDAGIVYTDALVVDGVGFEPQRIVDKNGTTWTVLARIEE